MPIVNCPWEACRSESEGKCTKKDHEKITLEVNREDRQNEGANCNNFEWPEEAAKKGEK